MLIIFVTCTMLKIAVLTENAEVGRSYIAPNRLRPDHYKGMPIEQQQAPHMHAACPAHMHAACRMRACACCKCACVHVHACVGDVRDVRGARWCAYAGGVRMPRHKGAAVAR